jgi:hypothetical protein
MADIAKGIGIVPSTLYQWRKNPDSVKPATSAFIVDGIHKLTSELSE